MRFLTRASIAALLALTLGGAAYAAPSDADKPIAGVSPPTPPEYTLAAGDELRIEVYKDAQLSQSVQVRPDGKVTLPLIGDVPAAGKTPIELRDELASDLEQYVKSPVVTVIVVHASAPTVYVVGEVYRSGPVALQGNMTVLQALAVAGGLKDFAKARNIRVLRRGPAGIQTIGFDYKNAVRGDPSEVIYLRAGDTIVVPD